MPAARNEYLYTKTRPLREANNTWLDPKYETWPQPAKWPAPVKNPFEEARVYANRLMPGAKLSYIPKRTRDVKNWIGDREYLDPIMGSLMWCGEGAPKTKAAMKRTSMYVIDNLVGATVDAVVRAAKREKREATTLWIGQTADWHQEAVAHERFAELVRAEERRQPLHYWGPLEIISIGDMYELIRQKGVTKDNFQEWISINPWVEEPKFDISEVDMRLMSISPRREPPILEEVEEDPKTTEEWTEEENQRMFEELRVYESLTGVPGVEEID